MAAKAPVFGLAVRLKRVCVVAACMGTAYVSFAPRQAHAWVCTRVADNYGDPSGPALVWPSRSVPWVFNAQPTTKLDDSAARAAIQAAFSVWSSSTLRSSEPALCQGVIDTSVVSATSTDLSFVQGADTNQSTVGYNYLEPDKNENVIIFRDTGWRYSKEGPSADVLAMTTLTYNVITGDILDADIEFNTQNSVFTTSDSSIKHDVQNTAAHEIGHLLGFAHSLDESATMYSSASLGETSKRELSCDDATILWYRYPTGAKTNSCKLGQVSKSCGQCAHAGGLAYTAKLQVRETHDGQGGCQSIATSSIMGPATLALLALRRRRKPGADSLYPRK